MSVLRIAILAVLFIVAASGADAVETSGVESSPTSCIAAAATHPPAMS